MQRDGKARVLVAAPSASQEGPFPEVVGNAVAVADWVVAADSFTSSETIRLTQTFRQQGNRNEELTRDIPGLPPQKVNKLDRRGIIAPGTPVQRGDVLVGKRVPRDAPGEVGNESLVYEFLDTGEVSSVRLAGCWHYQCNSCGDVGLFSSGKTCPYCLGRLTARKKDDLEQGVIIQVDVEVLVRRPLRVGDILEDERGARVVVARLVPGEQMPNIGEEPVAVWASGESLLAARLHLDRAHSAQVKLKKTTVRLEDKLMARGLGKRYSLISQLPLGQPGHFGFPQRVTRAQSQALLRAGYRANLQEMLTLKSDAPEARATASEALAAGKALEPRVPEMAHRLLRTLRALGLSPVFRTKDGQEVDPEQGGRHDALFLEVRGASPEDVRNWSSGEVKKPETINYRTYRPEPDGLFCERIFGPETDSSNCERRRRMGQIQLAAPVVHFWFRERIAGLLNTDTGSLNRLLYGQRSRSLFLVTDPGATPLCLGQLLTEDELAQRRSEYGPAAFQADLGAEAVRKVLRSRHGDRFDWLVPDLLPVLPPDLRPLVLLDNGNFATSDLNDLYRRTINRNNRLRKLIELNAPNVILHNEKRIIQQSVDVLFDNGKTARPVLGSKNRHLRSLADTLQTILGQLDEKPTDFSARGVVIPAPELEETTIGLPELMAQELYGGAALLARHPVLVISDEQRLAAFRPVRVEGEAIRLHPRAARRLGVTFAGDQVSLHVALGEDAVRELSDPRPHPDTSSVLIGLTPEKLVEMVIKETPVRLTTLDRIVLGLDDPKVPGS